MNHRLLNVGEQPEAGDEEFNLIELEWQPIEAEYLSALVSVDDAPIRRIICV
jgi:hypothetical protein